MMRGQEFFPDVDVVFEAGDEERHFRSGNCLYHLVGVCEVRRDHLGSRGRGAVAKRASRYQADAVSCGGKFRVQRGAYSAAGAEDRKHRFSVDEPAGSNGARRYSRNFNNRKAPCFTGALRH
jgi:hypothetical protein